MVIHLRPYHLFAVIRQLATGRTEEDFNGIPEVTRKIEKNHRMLVEVVRVFDDACECCTLRKSDRNGCLWGSDYSCPSARNNSRAKEVEKNNDEILRDLGIWIGTRMKAIDLLRLATIKRPRHYSKNKRWQEQYERGMDIVLQVWLK